MRLNSLSGRFLGLTIVFVLIAEVLIFVPSVARFRLSYLQNRLDLAQLGALALLAVPDTGVSPDLERELLATADVLNVVLQRDDVRELILPGEMPAAVEESFDIREASDWALMRDALRTFAQTRDRIIRVVGITRQGTEAVIEITLHEGQLRQAMINYGRRILLISFILTISTATLLFFAVRRLIVWPMQRVVQNMMAYREDPEDSSRVIEPRARAQEMRAAEVALRDLQLRLTGALRQKERLASLGGAVAKISHDLRNLLTTAQILADRIEASGDPGVMRTAPKLVSSLARAISLCERTLTFGKAEEPPPELALVRLAPIVAEVMENEQAAAAGVEIVAEIPEALRVRADPDQIFRVLTNLVRNAAQAIEASGKAGRITLHAGVADRRTVIRVRDTGPGLPAKARENLFQPFRGGARQGGSGLGLVIAAELVRGHGGRLQLVESGSSGTEFLIDLPAP